MLATAESLLKSIFYEWTALLCLFIWVDLICLAPTEDSIFYCLTKATRSDEKNVETTLKIIENNTSDLCTTNEAYRIIRPSYEASDHRDTKLYRIRITFISHSVRTPDNDTVN